MAGAQHDMGVLGGAVAGREVRGDKAVHGESSKPDGKSHFVSCFIFNLLLIMV